MGDWYSGFANMFGLALSANTKDAITHHVVSGGWAPIHNVVPTSPQDELEKEGSQVPNWCNNNITLAVDPEHEDVLKQAIALLQGEIEQENGTTTPTSFSLDRIAPTPSELLGIPEGVEIPLNQFNILKERYGTTSWYQWRTREWGTKWDVEVEPPTIVHEETVHYAHYNFDSAWNPPIGALYTLTENFPGLTVHLAYDEPGNDIGGVRIFRGGQSVGTVSEYGSLSNIMRQFEFEEYWTNQEAFEEELEDEEEEACDQPCCVSDEDEDGDEMIEEEADNWLVAPTINPGPPPGVEEKLDFVPMQGIKGATIKYSIPAGFKSISYSVSKADKAGVDPFTGESDEDL